MPKISSTVIIQIVPIIFIFIIIGYVYYVYIVLYCTKFLIYSQDSQVEGGLYIAFSNLFFLAFILAYFTVMFKSPKYTTDFALRRENTNLSLHPPPSISSSIDKNQIHNQDQSSQTTDQVANIVILRESEINPFKSYCGICFGSLRPLRAHHCIACDKCVLKMDHHCVWFYQCVGHGNYKAFILTLFYGFILCLFVFVTIMINIGNDGNGSNGSQSGREWYITIQMIIASFIAFVFGTAISILLGYHSYLLSCNLTTIEHREKREYPNPMEWKNPYDLGFKKNFLQVFDDNFLLWPIPWISSTKTNGTRFPRNDNL